MYKAEAHAKNVEHELVSKRHLELRIDNDSLMTENQRLRDALMRVGQGIDEMMIQNKQVKMLKKA